MGNDGVTYKQFFLLKYLAVEVDKKAIVGGQCEAGELKTIFHVALVVKNLLANAGEVRKIRKILWRRAGQPTPVFLPGEFHGQRSLMGYSP